MRSIAKLLAALAILASCGDNIKPKAAHITVTPTSGLTTTEAGASATFSVVLDTRPVHDVDIDLTSSNEGEGTVTPTSLHFTKDNWNAPQVVTVKGVQDDVADGNQTFTIVTSPAMSDDSRFDGVDPDDVSVNNVDDDTAGIMVTPTSGLVTTEAGGTATFTVVLNSKPRADVTIGVSSSDTTEGTASPLSLTFTAANWNAPQTVTVTGVDDDVADGAQSYTVVTAAAVSTDTGYNGLDADDVAVSNTDNDTAGITVTPTSGLVTTEAGGTATFTVVLNSQPTADVTIPIASSDTTEGTPDVASLTFTSANWNAPQTVTVTGVDDNVADGNQVYMITTGAATSTDTGYSGMDASDVSVTNTDNDSAGVTVTPTNGLTTTEAGGTATFTIVLNSQPTANVTFSLTSSDTSEGTVSPATVTFTSANWNAPQTVTVTGVDDALADGNQPYTITTGAAVSTDLNYVGMDPPDVDVTNIDNDSAGFIVTPTSGLTTTEAGGTATFTIVLTSQPTASVVVPLSSSDTGEGTVSTGSVTFTTANWNAPQTITITGVDDAIADGNQPYTIVTGAATSTDTNYSGANAADVSVTNIDNDTAGITVTPTSGLQTTEGGGQATFTVVLNSQPTANVTINLSSSDTTEGTVSPLTLTFTTANWNAPQTVTVTGVDDNVADGNQQYTIVTAAAVSSDTNYAGRNALDVTVTNIDNDSAGFIVTPTSGLQTTEAGGQATFTVRLTSQPTASVTVNLSSSDTSEGTVSPVSLTFTTANWNAPQTVTVTGVDDAVQDGNQIYTIVTAAATSADTGYAGLNPSDVTVTNIDNDSAGFIVTPTSGLTTTEAGGQATFTIRLTSMPTANVTIGLSSNDTTEGTVSPASVTFTTANWNAPQTVTITGVDDAVADGNQGYTIVTAPATSGDGNYMNLNPADVSVTNTDNDTAGITVTPTSGLQTTEAGGTATFTIRLNSQPTASVTIGLTSSDTTEGTVAPATVTFTTANWNAPQTVTVTGVNDAVADGNQPYTIVTGSAVSTDLTYLGINPADVSVTNLDNDSAGIVVSPTSGLVTTEAGGQDTFTIVLTSQPLASVTIGLSSSDTGEGTVSPASVTFTIANWNAPQTVTVTGVNDAVADGNQPYTIVTAAATSADTSYNTLNAADVSVTNTDNDTAGITVAPTSGLQTTEGGGTDTFTIVLNSQPTANVTIGISSSDTTEGTPDVSSVTFTTANWNAPQTITVTGVNDAVADGNQPYTIVTAAATSTDTGYSGVDASDVGVTNVDNDSAGFLVSPTSGLTTSEAGGQDTFTVVLTSQPTADVTIPLSSSDTGEGTVSPASLTFTSANWNAPQTVTVTGVDDAVADGGQLYTIVTGTATSLDTGYAGLDPANVSVTNTDNDTAGITVEPISGLSTSEGGGQDTFTIVLNSQPTANVTIGLSSSDTGEGTVSPASVTFTTANWNAPQTVTVTGVNDFIADGNQPYTIVTAAATSSDSGYSGLDAANVSVTNVDNDSAGIIVTPTSGLVTGENAATDTFTIVLASQPTASVTIGISTSDATEGSPDVSSVTFTTANWNAPQTITVTGADDAVQDGNQLYTIVTAAASSSDMNYNNLNASDVSVTNLDNDTAGIIVSPTSGLTVSETGTSTTFSIVLQSQPTSNVTISLGVNDPTEGSVSPSSVTFTPADWNAPQDVTVTGVDDLVADGNQQFLVVTGAATSSDTNYAGIDPADVTVTTVDNDSPGINVSPTSGLQTTEAAGTATFDVVLNSQPTANVTITLASSDTTEGTITQTTLTFTPVNWSSPQTVTITGVDDVMADGNQPYTITIDPATSSDTGYSGIDPTDVSVTNVDNDTASVLVSPTSGLQTTEAGGSAFFQVSLTSMPAADVTIMFSVSDATEGSLPVTSITFTTANWNVPQTVNVVGVNDAITDGNQPYTVISSTTSSTDPTWNGLSVANVSVTNLDDDIPGISVIDPLTGLPAANLITSEFGDTDTFTIVLNTQPTADVTISLTSNDTTEATVSPASVTFTSANWNVPQTITVTGVDDVLADGTQPYVIITAPAVSSDPNYSGLNAADVTGTNFDNDTPGVYVKAKRLIRTSESGNPQGKFQMSLTTMPSANVTCTLSSSDTTEGTVSPTTVTFTPANYNLLQNITVQGVDDAIKDGDQLYTIITAACTSTDPNYNNYNPRDVSCLNKDND